MGRLGGLARLPRRACPRFLLPGKLVNQDQLYKRADKVLSEVEGLITDIKKDPKRYFKFSVF